MNKQEIYEYLNQQHIWYEVTEHKAVYNMEDLSDVEIPYPQADAKGKWNASVKFCLGRRFN